MRVKLGIAAVIATASAIGVVGYVKSQGRGDLTPADIAARASSEVGAEASSIRVFFGHQSVGGNILDGVPRVFEAAGRVSPPVVEVPSDGSGAAALLPTDEPGYIVHALVGENGDPVGKMQAFDVLMRSGLGEHVDVAMVKFCYLDVTARTDVDALFAEYVDTMSALEADFPQVAFLHVTTPVTTASGLQTKIKAALGRGTTSDADNAARERLNSRMRATYTDDQLFDLAALESTAPDGSRTSRSLDSQMLYTLYDGYAIDDGHLDQLASEYAAVQWLAAVQRASD